MKSDRTSRIAPSVLPRSEVEVDSALQIIVFEMLGDLHLRFTVQYESFPNKLALLGVDNISEVKKQQVAEEFRALKDCCKKQLFETRFAGLFQTQAALLSNECKRVVRAWSENMLLVTKPVEFTHKTNSGAAKAKGHSKPATFASIADLSVVSRLGVMHAQSIGRQGKRQQHIKHHPAIKAVISRAKKKVKNSQRSGCGGNPNSHG